MPRITHAPSSETEHELLLRTNDEWDVVLLYRVTKTMLTKKIIDVRQENFPALAAEGLHDFGDAPNGIEMPILLVNPDGSTLASRIRWYAANTRQDARFRITDLHALMARGELFALGTSGEVVLGRNLSRPGPTHVSPGEQGEVVPLEASEGRWVERLHRARERDPRIVRSKKDSARQEHGALVCEACGFTPEAEFGLAGESAIEAHHLTPLATLPRDGTTTSVADLALLCATCHRLLHALDLSIDELGRRRRLGGSP